MKKIFTILGMCATFALNAQAFTATYAFANGASSPSGTLTGSNVTASDFSAVGVTATSTTGRYAYTDGTTSTSPDLAKYFEVTVTPASGYSVDVDQITFRSQRSGTGPRNYIVRSSVDGYSTNLPASVNPANAEITVNPDNSFRFTNDISTGQNGSTVTPTFTPQTAPITFRFYFYEAEAAGGTFSIDDVVITGTVTSTLGIAEIIATKSNYLKNTQVDNELFFQTKGNASVKIFNANGQLVKSATVSSANAVVNVSSLAKGIYIVTTETAEEKVSQKFIKK